MTNLKIKLKSYDHKILDDSTAKICSSLEAINAKLSGPVPLPTEVEKITILRSVHKHKDSREQFERKTHKRLLVIKNPSSEVYDQLKKIDLPSSISIEIK